MTFAEAITAAVNDLIEHGFTSQDRVDKWVAAIRKAAEDSLVPPAQVEKMLADGLSAIYRRLVDNGGIVRFNDVPRFKLEQIKPSLRAELDRRIMASANLIKLNRAQAIEQTLRRFQGWATSIPVGGTRNADKTETKQAIRKALTQLPFAERVVIIDQGHKLTAALSYIVATQSSAIAASWRSNFRQQGYSFREDHKERDGKVYLLRGNWAQEKGFVKPGPEGYYDDITQAGQEINCRCYIVWLYAIRDLPDSMVTQKGRDELARVRAQIAG